MLPPRRKPQKSGILRAAPRKWLRHEKWVRGHQCVVPGCPDRDIVFAHVRSAANAGIGIKPHSAFGISLCDMHHREQHQIGQFAFERKYSIDLAKLACEFARRSPDQAMRDSLQEGRDASR